MKRSIFVIDDKLNDVRGILFSLQAVLRKMCGTDTKALSEISIVFCHICWKNSEDTHQSNKSFFDHELNGVLAYIEGLELPVVKNIQYLPIELDAEEYSQDMIPKMANRVIDAQKESIRAFCGDDALAVFPNTDKSVFPYTYAVLLDIVLNLNKDCECIQAKKRVLSNELYGRFPDPHRIVFTNYDEGGITDNWMELSNTADEPIHRQYIARARGIYLPFKNKIYQAFGVKQDRR